MKKIGELKGKPIIEGNPNEVTKHEYHYKEECNILDNWIKNNTL